MDSLLSYITELADRLPPAAETALAIAALLLVAVIADLIAKRQLIRLMTGIASRTSQTWDDIVLRHNVFGRLAQIVPALIFYFGIAWVPGLPEKLVEVIRNTALAYMALMLTLAVGALLTAGNAIYEQRPESRERPIKGFVQVAKLAVYILGGVMVFAALMDRSPLVLLTGFGAMTAIVLLVFKDTILSLVASVQLSALDMVRVGDWIEMPQFRADGDVIDVSLHTVRVQNWDKTSTTIPTHKLISDSFKNWRGMSESGGRRIKRSINIDVSSVRFLTDAEVARFKRFDLLKDYIEDKRKELHDYNENLGDTDDAAVNLRRLTNLGTFRAYLVNYLRHHPRIHSGMTLLVRQLAPGEGGIPIEIYAFTNTTDWNRYEGIQADIFDHLLAICGEFGLSVFQAPSGRDFSRLGGAIPDAAESP